MCVTVSVKRGGKFTDCATSQELADALGIEPAKISNDPPHCCLCNADFAGNGAVRNPEPDEWWPEYIIDCDAAIQTR